MSIEVTVGDATVKLGALEIRNGAGVLSQTYDVDALLHAVQRACEAVGSCDGLQTTISDLRKHLAAHASRTCPGVSDVRR